LENQANYDRYYAGFRIYSHRHSVYQLRSARNDLSQLDELNRALDLACRPCFAEAPQRRSWQVYHQLFIFDQQQFWAAVTQEKASYVGRHLAKYIPEQNLFHFTSNIRSK